MAKFAATRHELLVKSRRIVVEVGLAEAGRADHRVQAVLGREGEVRRAPPRRR